MAEAVPALKEALSVTAATYSSYSAGLKRKMDERGSLPPAVPLPAPTTGPLSAIAKKAPDSAGPSSASVSPAPVSFAAASASAAGFSAGFLGRMSAAASRGHRCRRPPSPRGHTPKSDLHQRNRVPSAVGRSASSVPTLERRIRRRPSSSATVATPATALAEPPSKAPPEVGIRFRAVGPVSSPNCSDLHARSDPEAPEATETFTPGTDRGPRSAKAKPQAEPDVSADARERDKDKDKDKKDDHEAICRVGVDAMALCLSYLDPSESYAVLTEPLSKSWRAAYATPSDLWRALCLSDPFRAKPLEGDEEDSDDDSNNGSYALNQQISRTTSAHSYRLLYTSLVRCAQCLSKMRNEVKRMENDEDTTCGLLGARGGCGRGFGPTRSPSSCNFRENAALRDFLARARTIVRARRKRRRSSSNGDHPDSTDGPIGVLGDGTSLEECGSIGSEVSEPTKVIDHLTGKSAVALPCLPHSRPSNPPPFITKPPPDLAKSCAVRSLINFMFAFEDAEGAQLLCLEAIPFLLSGGGKDDDIRRVEALRFGMPDALLRSVLSFPDSPSLHAAAFRALVLLARPPGGAEGTVLSSLRLKRSLSVFDPRLGPMVQHGPAIIVDSLQRHSDSEEVQASGLWSLVNVALDPRRRAGLVCAGGLRAASTAMERHPQSAEVQFRALFALINLVIPPDDNNNGVDVKDPISPAVSARALLEESVWTIANLTANAMRAFHFNEAVLNRACLVLHNLSLEPRYHGAMLLAPDLYQLVEWSMRNYAHDPVLVRSAGGTLQRLGGTLERDRELRTKLAETARHWEGGGQMNQRMDSLA